MGRAAATFGVDEIIIFPDSGKRNQRREIDLIATVLSYMETPQYLRKRLFKIRPELGYAGVLPPLRTPHHPLANREKDLVDGEHREGAVVSHAEEGSLVDVGVERNALVRNRKLPIDTRVTVRIKKTQKLLEAETVDRREIKEYWGYRVTASHLAFSELLKKRDFDLVIATSKHGKPLLKTTEELMSRWKTSRRILVAFGAPTRGLYEIVKQENRGLDAIADFVVNVFPRQEVETVRTEEAVFVALGILNALC